MKRLIACYFLSHLLVSAAPVQDIRDLLAVEAKVQEVAAKRVPITVALVAPDQSSSGSGVITTADGLIMTAAHVIQGHETMDVVFPDGKTVKGKVLGANYGKDIAIGAEPVRLLSGRLHLVGERVIENLDLDALRQPGFGIGRELLDRLGCGPHKHARVPGWLLMAPFHDHFEILIFFRGAEHADRLPGAGQHSVFP